jgi:hypothetical protein
MNHMHLGPNPLPTLYLTLHGTISLMMKYVQVIAGSINVSHIYGEWRIETISQ